jgi:hypothetical protein
LEHSVTQNDIIILDSTLAQKKQAIHAPLDDATYFEVFCAEQVLKNYDLSYEELLDGIVGGGDDGGIDSFQAFVDGELLDEDTEISKYKKNPVIDIFLVQAKQSSSFAEVALDKLHSTLTNIFNLALPIADLQKIYNAALVSKTKMFREAFLALSARHPQTHIHVVYATKGDTTDLHPKVDEKAGLLKEQLQKVLPGCDAEVVFWGARELLEAAQHEKTYTLQLRLIENPISTGSGGYVALVNVKDYWQFVTDGGSLRKYIFESNVRDWQGDVEVNEEIRETLDKEQDPLDFWWLNNGITILCSRASIAGKTINMDDVQVVNGLQTTVTIHEYIKADTTVEEKRSLLVRIITTDNPEARDRIIKATNHQTAIPPASLKATDRIQRDLETYFKQHGWYYDRRKNYYKNLGMPVDKIIGIPYLAQTVMAILLREPDNARARPTTLIKNEDDYKRVFSESTGFDLYLYCAKLMKAVEDRVRLTAPEYPNEFKRNLRFQVATVYVALAFGNVSYKATDVKALVDKPIDDALIDQATRCVVDSCIEFVDLNQDWSIDKTVKSKEFLEELLKGVDQSLQSSASAAIPDAPLPGA